MKIFIVLARFSVMIFVRKLLGLLFHLHGVYIHDKIWMVANSPDPIEQLGNFKVGV